MQILPHLAYTSTAVHYMDDYNSHLGDLFRWSWPGPSMCDVTKATANGLF